ncbi:hypothetical protein FGO68_gene11229 [Halteria grandinella]|uniref:Uncharacterized protein n=1 Tax=Halteria grandinella TaxID=5974 RepID=A0A8J8T8R2_HALGN|nr:hypothetical protein FGO68_gene11229 [Halteria grandinella]
MNNNQVMQGAPIQMQIQQVAMNSMIGSGPQSPLQVQSQLHTAILQNQYMNNVGQQQQMMPQQNIRFNPITSVQGIQMANNQGPILGTKLPGISQIYRQMGGTGSNGANSPSMTGLSPRLANLNLSMPRSTTDSPRSLPPPDPRTSEHDSMFKGMNVQDVQNSIGGGSGKLDPVIQNILLNNIQQRVNQENEVQKNQASIQAGQGNFPGGGVQVPLSIQRTKVI